MRAIRFISLLVALVALAAVTVSVTAQRGDDADRPSKNGETEGAIDGVQVTLEYGRPNVKGRTIWGELVPHGKVWRTGANEATTITFGGDVLVEGKPLAAGTYGLFTVPGESQWTFIFNKVPNQWGAFNYDSAEDALRVEVEPSAGEHVESMDFVIDGDHVTLRWEKLSVGFAVKKAA
jgi:hypothetical protein